MLKWMKSSRFTKTQLCLMIRIALFGFLLTCLGLFFHFFPPNFCTIGHVRYQKESLSIICFFLCKTEIDLDNFFCTYSTCTSNMTFKLLPHVLCVHHTLSVLSCPSPSVHLECASGLQDFLLALHFQEGVWREQLPEWVVCQRSSWRTQQHARLVEHRGC